MFLCKQQNNKIKELEGVIEELRQKVRTLETEKQMRLSIKQVLTDARPKDPTARRKFVSDMAGVWGMGFNKQIDKMIHDQMVTNANYLPEHLRVICLANINCLQLIKEWFEEQEKEHFSYLNQARQQVENEGFVEDIRSKYK